MTTTPTTTLPQSKKFPPLPLPPGITESYITTETLTYHILSSSPATASITSSPSKAPLILLLHGFPELAFSYRKIMLPLANAGYRVVAYDQRGYGRTSGWDTRPYDDVDLASFSVTTLVTDALRLVAALGYEDVACLVGHDFGAVVAGAAAAARGDVFKRVVLMSHPFKPTPQFSYDISQHPPAAKPASGDTIHAALASLTPPRKHYKWYYSTRPASNEMTRPSSGIHTFLRGYFHLKSADWAGNSPHRLESWTADELAQLPHYYVMPLNSGMRDTVAADMAKEDASAVRQKSSRWLPDSELAVFADEFGRNSFQGGLNWYRVGTDEKLMKDMEVFAGKKIEVPFLFVAGRQDWGAWQAPGALDGLPNAVKKGSFAGVKWVDGAGHWVQQEQPEEVVRLVLQFLEDYQLVEE